ncbi:MAG TPA: adenylate/guanylate cyclase domain-containing protein [Stellaceae bacterium]|nr:adenylate/guanylate cyclase domain-containing protein [Stellaceae bacterium]
MLIYSDITECKRAEAAIHEARDAAEKALGELRATQQQLVVQQKMAALGQLTAGIAHEIKNPLNFVNNLARYFSPNLVETLAERDEPLGAVRRETVAVLFADIVGFTHMTERMMPEAVVAMLRRFHERMTAKIFACGGTVEKYIGDAIFAVFGLPNAGGPADAANALDCADRMLAALDIWNRERTRHGEPVLAIGLGLNYGPAVIGDVGSEHGLSFTVIGDMVNIAHRLQGLTRTLRRRSSSGMRSSRRRAQRRRYKPRRSWRVSKTVANRPCAAAASRFGFGPVRLQRRRTVAIQTPGFRGFLPIAKVGLGA